MLQICKIIYFQQLTRPPQASNLGLEKVQQMSKRTNRNKKMNGSRYVSIYEPFISSS